MNVEMQEELLMLLRGQQRELTELCGQIEAMQSSIMAHVEHVLTNHQEQERILPENNYSAIYYSDIKLKATCIFLWLHNLRPGVNWLN